MANAKHYDIVPFGASGFTGGLLAEYLAQVSKKEAFRWALAGRNADKLNQVKAKLAAIAGVIPDILLADIEDSASIAAMTASTAAVIPTVGPHPHWGKPLVKACAENGTHYVDLTGEPQFVDRMHVNYDAIAKNRRKNCHPLRL